MSFYTGIILDLSSFIPDLRTKSMKESSGSKHSRGNLTLRVQHDSLISNVIQHFPDCDSHILKSIVPVLICGAGLQESCVTRVKVPLGIYYPLYYWDTNLTTLKGFAPSNPSIIYKLMLSVLD